MNSKVVLLGIRFDAVDMAGAVAWARVRWSSRASCRIATVNLSILAAARQRPDIGQFVATADLVVCDGAPLVRLSRMRGVPLPERVAGIDLLDELLASAAAENRSVFFLGGRADVLEAAVHRFEEVHPGIRVVGMSDGYFPASEQERVAASIRRSSPDLLVMAMGTEREAAFVRRVGCDLDCGVAIGVGGSLEVAAGRKKRAPKICQDWGMEWAYRMVQEPIRLGSRYAWTAVVIARILAQEGVRGHRVD